MSLERGKGLWGRSRERRAAEAAAARAWMEGELDRVREGERRAAGEEAGEGRLDVARALVRAGSRSWAVERLLERLAVELGGPAGEVSRAALVVQVLCADPKRMSVLPVTRAIERGVARLAEGPFDPDVVRALLAAGAGEDTMTRALDQIEHELEACAREPLAPVATAADRLHAWHVGAMAVERDLRRHVAVHRATLALIQRVEAAGGEIAREYDARGMGGGGRTDSATMARTALALFAVEDRIIGPRAGFAAELLLDSVSARAVAGGMRATHRRFAPASARATALFAEALAAAEANARQPWSLPSLAPLIPLDGEDGRASRRA